MEQLPGRSGDDRGQGPVLLALHGPGSHCWTTPEAGGKVDRENPTQFGRAMARLGIEMIPAHSPEARGRSERAFGTHQGRLPKELALAGATDLDSANRCLAEVCLPAFNAEFAQPARDSGSAFAPCRDPAALDDVLCGVHERTVGRDNCVRFEGLALQLPADRRSAPGDVGRSGRGGRRLDRPVGAVAIIFREPAGCRWRWRRPSRSSASLPRTSGAAWASDPYADR